MGSAAHHGTPFRHAVEDGLIDPKRSVQVGIRGPQNDTEGWDYAEEAGMRVISMDEAARIGIDEVIAETRRVVGDGPVYLSFDIDGLDPAFAPGTGTPEIGGFTTLEAQRFLRGLQGRAAGGGGCGGGGAAVGSEWGDGDGWGGGDV